MLKKLHRKLVCIIMVIIGIAITAVLALTLINARSSYSELTYSSLNKALEERGREPQKEDEVVTNAGHVSIVWADISSDGYMLATNLESVSIDSDIFEAVIADALASASTKGTLAQYHVIWKKGETPFGSRIAIADTTSIDSYFEKQIILTIGIGLVSFCALYVVANLLAKWILKPVETAWDQQHQFVADASHELKTPLAVILANSQILKKSETEIPEQYRRWIDSTSDEAARMKGLVEELLELARTEEGAGTSRLNEDVDFSDIVEGEAMQFDAVAFERTCTIETTIEDGIHVMGDSTQLERLTKTLIDNACKYAATGSVIDVSLCKHSSSAELSVTNQGAPMDEEDLKHVFDRFYRSDKARARDTGGFGLGLAIARGIAEGHNGKISATSSAEKGTCFKVVLPLKSKTQS